MSPFSSSVTCRLFTALYTSRSVFAPVQTSFPEAKRSIMVLGSGILWIKPGNCSGSYIDFGSVLAASALRPAIESAYLEGHGSYVLPLGKIVLEPVSYLV